MQRKRQNNKTRARQRLPRSAKFAAATKRSTTATRTRIAPDELDIKLMFRKADKLTNGLGGVVAKSFHTNAAYDVDPSVGSTETLGYDEYAALYSYYRVIGYSYQVTAINLTEQPVLFSVINAGLDATTQGSNFSLYATNPYCKSQLCPPIYNTGNTHVFRGSHTCAQFVGTPTIETADSFRAITSGIPSDLTWITIAGENVGGGTDITFTYDFKLIMHVRFYGREVDLTLAASIARMTRLLELRSKHNEKKKERALIESLTKSNSVGTVKVTSSCH